MSRKTFKFKQFEVNDSGSAMKLGVDGVLLGAWVSSSNPSTITDIGTGSGVIALQMAQKFPEALITAVESNHNAFKQAKENFENSNWTERIHLIHEKIQNCILQEKQDIIICNPPFFKGESLEHDQDRNEARSSIFLPINELLHWSKKHLSKHGELYIVYPMEYWEELERKAIETGLFPKEVVFIKGHSNAKTKRVMARFTLDSTTLISSILTIKDEAFNFTPEYLSIVRDFYLFA